MGERLPRISRNFTDLRRLGVEPSGALVALLTSIFTELPDNKAVLPDGCTVELESEAVGALEGSSRRLMDMVKANGPASSQSLLKDYKALFQVAAGSVPCRDELRRRAKDISGAFDKVAMEAKVEKLENLAEDFMSGENNQDPIISSLSKLHKNHIDPAVVICLQKLATHVVARLSLRGDGNDGGNGDVTWLDDVLSRIDESGVSQESVNLQLYTLTLEVNGILASLPGPETSTGDKLTSPIVVTKSDPGHAFAHEGEECCQKGGCGLPNGSPGDLAMQRRL